MNPKALQSRHNPTVKKVLKLRSRPEKYAPAPKSLSGEVLIEGPRPLTMAIEAGAAIKSALITEDILNEAGYDSILEKLTGLTIPVFVIDKDRMAQISDTVTPQGIIAICKVKARDIHDLHPEKDELFVVSDAIQDPGNTGTIIRVCDGAGIRAFISLKGSANPFNPKVIRASAGSVFSLDIVLAEREDFIEWCRGHNIPILITAPEADKTIFEFDLEGRGALVFGNETQGVSKDIRQEAACSLRIPIYGRAESLNVASTAAITIYEFITKKRKRNKNQTGLTG